MTTSPARAASSCPRICSERELLAEALSAPRAAIASTCSTPQRGEKKDLVDHALANAREALGRKLAETSSQQALLQGAGRNFRPAARRRAGSRSTTTATSRARTRSARMIVAGPEGFREEPVPQVQHPLRRSRARRRLRHDARGAGAPVQAADQDEHPRAATAKLAAAHGGRIVATDSAGDLRGACHRRRLALARPRADRRRPGPAYRRARDARRLGVTDVPLVAVAKGVDRDAGRETFFMPGASRSGCRRAIRCSISSSGCATRRTASPSARTARGASATSAKAACRKFPASARPASARCSHHFGTLKAIERASLADLAKVPGISADTARRIYDFFHERAGLNGRISRYRRRRIRDKCRIAGERG